MRGFLVLVSAALAAPLAASAQSFANKDWQVVCDNTLTCRAVGYQRDGEDPRVSVLLERPAGPQASVTGIVQVANDEGSRAPAKLALMIGGKPVGTIAMDRATNRGALSASQVESLLKALTGTSAIGFTSGKTTWKLSGDGAASVLLKMDDVQGRIGTAGAIARRGTLGDDNVRLPQAPPTLRAVRILPSLPGDAALAERIVAMIPHSDDCVLLDNTDARSGSEAPRLWHLDANRVLVTTACWRAAYNSGDGYWIANLKPPFAPRVITFNGTNFDEATSTLSSEQKGRGMGDCASSDSWTWNGFAFEPSASSSTGMCRAIALGGAWNLPSLVTRVIPAN